MPVWDFTWPMERFIDAQNCKSMCPKVFIFAICKNLKMREKILRNPQTFFNFCYIMYKKKMLTDRATILKFK